MTPDERAKFEEEVVQHHEMRTDLVVVTTITEL
jgi:hypothetical protein